MGYSRKSRVSKKRKSFRGGKTIKTQPKLFKKLSYGDLDFSMSPPEIDNPVADKIITKEVKPKVSKESIDFSTAEIEELAVARPPSPVHMPVSRHKKKSRNHKNKISRNNKNKISRNKRPPWRPAGPVRYPY
jgi:hypothetical protein